MARKAAVVQATITDRLAEAKARLEIDADIASEQADFYAQQIGLLRKAADTAEKQAEAVEAAQDILVKAGVVL